MPPSATFTAYAPVGDALTATYGYSQALVLHPAGFVKLSGQGGWGADSATPSPSLPPGADEQVRLACDNVERALAAAGVVGGWKQVINVRSYHTDIDSSFALVGEEIRTRAPHKPLWTAVGVARLALPEMQIEIEVEALMAGE
ncbi:hypothetical protein JCM3770_001614 [Rhodotorula araucariae]